MRAGYFSSLLAQREAMLAPLRALQGWASARSGGDAAALATLCERLAEHSPAGLAVELAGPTGERNLYRTLGRVQVLSLSSSEADRLCQLAATLAVGSHAVWPATAAALRARLPQAVQAHIRCVPDWAGEDPSGGFELPPATVAFDAVLLHGPQSVQAAVAQALAARDGPLVPLLALTPGDTALPLERLLLERAQSHNTAAAGGNASLMMLN